MMEKRKRKYHGKKIWEYGIFFIVLLLLIWTIWGNTALTVTKITVSSEKIPPAFSGFRIAHISDLHNAEFGKDNQKLLQKLSDSNPDIIVITGDLVDGNRTDLEVAAAFAEESVKIAPSYYVTGNHEASISEYGELKNRLEAAGVHVLEDEEAFLEREGEKILLFGLSDPNFSMESEWSGGASAIVKEKLKKWKNQGKYTILLSHRPELFKTYVSAGIDLVFSGHAHGGQFRLPFVGGLIAPDQGLFPKYDAGLYTEKGTNMVVSRGLGNSIIPIRFNNRPEIVVVDLTI